MAAQPDGGAASGQVRLRAQPDHPLSRRTLPVEVPRLLVLSPHEGRDVREDDDMHRARRRARRQLLLDPRRLLARHLVGLGVVHAQDVVVLRVDRDVLDPAHPVGEVVVAEARTVLAHQRCAE